MTTRQLFAGRDVLKTERGQCELCKSGVVRVLVAENGWRKWYAADYGNYGYVSHTCGPSSGAPSRKVA